MLNLTVYLGKVAIFALCIGNYCKGEQRNIGIRGRRRTGEQGNIEITETRGTGEQGNIGIRGRRGTGEQGNRGT